MTTTKSSLWFITMANHGYQIGQSLKYQDHARN